MVDFVNYRPFNHTTEYVTVKSNGIAYPENCGYEIIGNILTSRVYGKDLSIFEIASSGRIAVTLNDIYSLDLKRSNNTVFLTTIAENDSLSLNSSNEILLNSKNIIANVNSNIEFNSEQLRFNTKEYIINTNNLLYNCDTSITLSVPGSAIQLLPNNLTIQTECNFLIQSQNEGYIRTESNLFLDANQKAFLTLSSTGGTASLRGDEIQFNINDQDGFSNVLKIYKQDESGSNIVLVSGNLVITGTFETQSVTNTNLTINDKIIEIAYSSDDSPTEDGVLNDSSGIKIDGVVSNNNNFNTDTDKLTFYNKSILWKYNKGGVDLLGKAEGVQNDDLAESYWNVRGGGMQFSVVRQKENLDLDFVSYGFRINEYDQFELYKRYKDATTSKYVLKRISRWGGCGNIIL